MKFTISKQVFLDGLRQVASVVSSKTTLPILSNVKIEAENGQIRFTATDLDVCITGVVPANVLREGTVTLPAKKLVSIISELPEAEVQVDVNQRNQAAVRMNFRNCRLLSRLLCTRWSRICCVTVSAGRNMPFPRIRPATC